MTRKRAQLSHATTVFALFVSVLPLASTPPLFLPAVTYSTGGVSRTGFVAVADVNGDGKPDIIATNTQGTLSSVGILLGNGDGTLQPAQTYPAGYEPTSIAVADVNGDGRPDLVVSILCNYPDCHGLAGVLLGNGDGTFQPVATYLSGGFFAESIKAADVNGDGKPDLLVSNFSTNVIQSGNGVVGVLLNNGDGTFQPVQTYDSGGDNTGEIEVADVNSDGKFDLLVANGGLPGYLGVLLGNGDGTFRPAQSYNTTGTHGATLAVADVNGDGRPDVVVARECVFCENGGVVDVLMGNGDGTFQELHSYSTGGYIANSIKVADVNEDGKPDILVADCKSPCFNRGVITGVGQLAVLLGNGDGTFNTAQSYNSGGRNASSVAVADLNRDSKLDAVVANFGDHPSSPDTSVGVLLNNTPFDTTPPVITLSATPKVLWPPNGRLVPATVSGTITDAGSGVNVNSAAYAVKDEYGEVQPTGAITLGPGGNYSFTVLLQASRRGPDVDGRRYTITVRAKDNAGNGASKTSVVTVPHDQGH
jgi:hypothetical protein